jgi:hypothetical protein
MRIGLWMEGSNDLECGRASELEDAAANGHNLFFAYDHHAVQRAANAHLMQAHQAQQPLSARFCRRSSHRCAFIIYQ